MTRLTILAALIVTLNPTWSNAADACDRAPEELLYAASFKAEAAGTKMRLVIGRAKAGATLTAQIWSADTCQATCAVRSWEAETPFSSQALHLDCRSARMSAFSAPATLLWPEKAAMRPQNAPMLRFGTWLSGYSQTPLLVELDRYAIAQTEGRQIARAR